MARRADLPLHSDKGKTWNGPAAAARMLDAATDGEGVINSGSASEGFTYMLNGGENRGDYKSPFADIIDGTKKVVWGGVNAALARNNQVQGISEDERTSGETFLRGQQARFPDSDEEDRMSYRNVLPFQLEEPQREEGRVLVASGGRSRNRDWWTNKNYRLVPMGMRIENWEKNPLVLWMHDFNIPLAKANLFIEDNKLWADDDLKFHRRKIPLAIGWLGSAVGEFDTGVIADLWEEEFYNAVSIHVLLSREDEDEIIEEEDEIIFPFSEVIEFSIVTIPGDPDAVREEFMDRLIHKGVERAVAECVTCKDGLVWVPQQKLWMSRNTLLETEAARSGSNRSKVYPVSMEENMGKKELVEKTPAAAAEGEILEEVSAAELEELLLDEVKPVVEEQEFQISPLDLVNTIIEDEDALATLAIALVNKPGILELLRDQLGEIVPGGEIRPAAPHRVMLKFVNGGSQRETKPKPPARQTAPKAPPIAEPGQNRRMPSVLDLHRG